MCNIDQDDICLFLFVIYLSYCYTVNTNIEDDD